MVSTFLPSLSAGLLGRLEVCMEGETWVKMYFSWNARGNIGQILLKLFLSSL